ncbi:MAG: efflux RND transporter periplasmic adaptor subunit, partial [Cyanobacteria bacterium P01_G01_bin.19]
MQIGKHLRTVFLALTICALLGCENEARRGGEDKISAETESSNVRAAISVDVETASLSDVSLSREYKGITQPQKEVAWRSQTEGILLELSADLGDGVEQGQVIGKLDDSLLVSDLAGRMAELSVLESELAQANIQVKNAQIRLDEAQIQLEQAESEAKRYQNLAATGIIPEQQAESFKTTAKIAGKTVLTAQESIKLEQKAVAIIEGRIATQRSAISESQQRQTYSQIRVPIDGTVIAKQRDPGSLVRVGEEIITVGDLSKIKLIVPISELDLGEVRIGQEVRVSLDAFQNQKFAGRVSRISPTTNLQSRQIPI